MKGLTYVDSGGNENVGVDVREVIQEESKALSDFLRGKGQVTLRLLLMITIKYIYICPM